MAICPHSTQGVSTWLLPTQPNSKQSTTKVQKSIANTGLLSPLRTIGLDTNGKRYKAPTAKPIVNTPGALYGIERRMAYIGRKYHSGTILGGVTIGLAGT